MAEEQIRLTGISKIYGNAQKKEAEIVALSNATFSINKGELVFILGPSGAGKSTLLNILGGMDKATSGEYIINGIDVTKLNETDLAKFRRSEIGFVFQFYNLVQNLNVIENVELASLLSEINENLLQKIIDKI